MLRVWLPLTKDLRNQGLSNVTVTNNGATFNSAGKLGGCYSFDGTDDRIYANNVSINNSAMSACCWVKFNNLTSSDYPYIFSLGSNTSGPNMQLGLSVWKSDTKIHLVGNGSEPSSGYTPPTNTWIHLCITINGATTKLYVNGILTSTQTNANTPKTQTCLCLGARSNSTSGAGVAFSYPMNGYINDFRLYDHCLSPMEVKELSKGLVLYYPLNRNGWGQENLMPNSVEMPVGSANPSTGTWRLAGGSQMTRSRVAISDAPTGASTYGFQSIGLQTGQDASCWGIDGFPRENGTTYTLSAWGRIVGGSTTAAMLGFSVYSGTTLDYGGTYGQAKSSDIEYYGSGAYDYAGGRLNPNGSWTRIYRTFTSTSTSDNIYIGFNTAKTGNNVTLQLCGVKLEKSDKMTPWVPHNEESLYTTMGLNSTTEYDCSGFCNNGTRIGTFNWTSNTPKYSVSTKLESGSEISMPFTYNIDTNPISIGCWHKINTNGTYNPIFSLGTAKSGLTLRGKHLEGGNGSSNFDYTISALQNNSTWHHTMFTYDGTNIRVYQNGELIYTQAAPAVGLSSVSQLQLGKFWATCNSVKTLCDFRIYATALSASDVLSLYQNCATIDPDGTIRGQIRS